MSLRSCVLRILTVGSHQQPCNRPFSAEASTSYNIWSWGRGSDGSLGNTSGANSYGPQQIATRLTAVTPPALKAGMWHSGALVDGTAYLWGKGNGGRLGLGDEASRFVPTPLAAQELQSLDLGGQHSAAISATGSLLTWGYGGFGCLGHAEFARQLVPKAVENLYCNDSMDQSVFQTEVNSAPQVSAGGSHTLVVDKDEGEGRLGVTHTMISRDRVLNFFLQVPLPKQVVSVAAGGFASYALTTEGEVFAWGGNGNGELGIGAWGWSGIKPRCIEKLTKHKIVQLAAGGFHAAALSASGTVFTWGLGKMGALGQEDNAKRAEPTRVPALRNETIVKVCCGPTSTYAIASDGRLFAWGNNSDNCLGLTGKAAGQAIVFSPVLHEGHPAVIDVAAGSMHGLALVAEQ